MTDERPRDDGRAFFGRRKSHKLRAGREAVVAALLPRLRIALPPAPAEAQSSGPAKQAPTVDPQSLFAGSAREAWLEIGFGGGEHLIARALENPDVAFIGCEAYVDGLARLIGEIERHAVTNIRLYDGDANQLLERLSPASIARIFLLYPDPWPKRRHRKRRFISDERLAALARILKRGGEFRFATDIDDYAAWTLARALRSPLFEWAAERADDWRIPWPNWRATRYEAKAVRKGRRPVYLTFRRI